jgi:putative hydrolase of the HAD superfamily
MDIRSDTPIRLVGFDGDDTLWRSQDFFDAAQQEFESILAAYVDLGDSRDHL